MVYNHKDKKSETLISFVQTNCHMRYYSKVIETPSDTSSLWLEGVERIEALAEILSTPSLIAAKAKPRLL